MWFSLGPFKHRGSRICVAPATWLPRRPPMLENLGSWSLISLANHHQPCQPTSTNQHHHQTNHSKKNNMKTNQSINQPINESTKQATCCRLPSPNLPSAPSFCLCRVAMLYLTQVLNEIKKATAGAIHGTLHQGVVAGHGVAAPSCRLAPPPGIESPEIPEGRASL